MHFALMTTGMRAICGLTLLGLFTFAQRADACSCGANGEIASSQPAAGATDVPLNIAPVVTANVADWPAAGAQTDSVVWLDEEGEPVPAVRRAFVANPLICTAQIEWIPTVPLKANHTYTILVQRSGPDGGTDGGPPFDSIAFTTGDTELDLPSPSRPEIATKFFSLTSGQSTCDLTSYRGCVASREPQMLEVITRGSSGIVMATLVEQMAPLYLAEPSSEHCLEVKARDATGQRSTAAVRCPGDSDFEPTSSTGIFNEDLCQLNAEGDFGDAPPPTTTPAANTSTSSGCNLSRSHLAGSCWLNLALTLCISLLARRRMQVS
jgi:hypothetical protein